LKTKELQYTIDVLLISLNFYTFPRRDNKRTFLASFKKALFLYY